MELCPAVEVHGALWTALLHPGSTNTSGFLKHLQKAMELVYTWVSQEELEAARRAHADMAQGEERPPKFQPPAKRKGTAGGGSLAAAGQTAAQPQNRGSFTAIEPELLGVLAWLLNESAVDSAVPGKLWDSVTWDRPVMQSNKQFQVVDPFFSFVAAGHLHELLEKLMRDSLGLRQRLTVVFARPLFLQLEEITAACEALPPETKGKPAVFMARFLYPLLKWSLRGETQADASGDDKGAVFAPRVQDGAMTLVQNKFNFRNEKQRAHFLEQGTHKLAKYHGKLKTKYDRMVLGVWYLHCLSEHHKRMQQAGVRMDSQGLISEAEIVFFFALLRLGVSLVAHLLRFVL